MERKTFGGTWELIQVRLLRKQLFKPLAQLLSIEFKSGVFSAYFGWSIASWWWAFFTGDRQHRHGHLHHHESRLRRSLQPSRQPQKAVPKLGHDQAGRDPHRRGHALLSGIPISREAVQEDRPVVQALPGAAVCPEPLRFWIESSQVCLGKHGYIILLVVLTQDFACKLVTAAMVFIFIIYHSLFFANNEQILRDPDYLEKKLEEAGIEPKTLGPEMTANNLTHLYRH